MSNDVTGRWYLSQTVNGIISMGTLSLQQQGSKISGNVEWDDHQNDSIVGVVIVTVVSFSVIHAGNLVGHYAADLSESALDKMSHGVCINKTGDSGSWEAKKSSKS